MRAVVRASVADRAAMGPKWHPRGIADAETPAWTPAAGIPHDWGPRPLVCPGEDPTR
jgi:hypothetical protein